jgi:hypothetical protein
MGYLKFTSMRNGDDVRTWLRQLACDHRGGMSALPPKADKERTCRDVRFVPKADIRIAAKNLGIRSLGRRVAEDLGARSGECLRSLKVDHQVSLIWCLHRQFAWLGSLEDSIDVEFAVGLLLALNRKKNCWLAPLADQPTDSAEQKLAACEPLTKTFNSRFLIRNRVPGSQPPWEPP